MTFTKTLSDVERFMAFVVPEPNSGCWLWTGYVNSDGYAQFGVNGSSVGAHRWAYKRFVGEVSAPLMLDHKCRVRSCVNPDHLEAVTNRENARRGAMHGTFGKRNRSKMFCPHGHPLTGENVHIHRNGRCSPKRCCMTCKRARDMRRYLKAREAAR